MELRLLGNEAEGRNRKAKLTSEDGSGEGESGQGLGAGQLCAGAQGGPAPTLPQPDVHDIPELPDSRQKLLEDASH